MAVKPGTLVMKMMLCTSRTSDPGCQRGESAVAGGQYWRSVSWEKRVPWPSHPGGLIEC